jgi:hypothetical protein
MQNLPLNLAGFRLLVTEQPAAKTREVDGKRVPVTNRAGETQFVVGVFLKRRPVPGQDSDKGEDIRVNLPVDPGNAFELDTQVELIDPVVNVYELRNDDGVITRTGQWYKAAGLKPVTSPPKSKDRPASAEAGSR